MGVYKLESAISDNNPTTEMLNQQPLVSLIIPVYNTARYLQICMDSIWQQTYDNLEIILIDDGSTDESGKLCDMFAQKDRRVISLHQKNTGQASARNYGMKVMHGEYVIFVDSDDYIHKNHVKKLVEVAVTYQADFVQGLMQKFIDEQSIKKTRVSGNVEEYSKSTALKEFCYQRKFTASPWCKLIQVSLLTSHEFPVGVGYEDMAFIYPLIGKARKAIILNEVLYYYRQHELSTMHESFSEKKIDRIRIASQLKEYIDEYFPENSKAVNTRYLLAQLQLLMQLPFAKKYKELRNEVKENIKSSRNIVIKDRESKNSIRVMAVATYLGLPITMCLGRLYNRCINKVR